MIESEQEGLDPDRMAERGDEARRLIRQNGVTYNVYGDPLGLERPWPLDLMPLVLSAESKDLRWIPARQLADFTTEPSVLRLHDKTRQLHAGQEKRHGLQ